MNLTPIGDYVRNPEELKAIQNLSLAQDSQDVQFLLDSIGNTEAFRHLLFDAEGEFPIYGSTYYLPGPNAEYTRLA